jgi:hypothetical protein
LCRGGSVEIGSPPGLSPSGLSDKVFTAVHAVVDDAVDKGELVEGAGTASKDGRVGGTWVVDATSAEEAVAKASAVLRHALERAGLDPHKAIVDYLYVEPVDL